jgi:hypothetical protein
MPRADLGSTLGRFVVPNVHLLLQEAQLPNLLAQFPNEGELLVRRKTHEAPVRQVSNGSEGAAYWGSLSYEV